MYCFWDSEYLTCEKICDKINLGILPDEIIEKIKNVDINSIALNSMEKSMLKDAISHL